jgi:WXG100 family type VII secretion target
MADVPPSTTVGGVTYRVTPEYVAQASADTARTAGEISTELAQLKTYVNSLEDVWQGIAHNQFQTLMAEYDIYANMLHEALMNISKGLEGNYVNYKSSEQQNLSNLSALGEDLPTPASGTNFR